MLPGLPIVYDGVRQPHFDIVSIPGLPTIQPTYKAKDHTKWLREVLSHQVPQARIMAFQYDFPKESTEISLEDLFKNVTNLLYSLTHRREGTEDRPVLFICYSFGAFVLKRALLEAKKNTTFRNILDMTRGIIFLGCLHNETNPQLEELCLKCAAVELGVIMKNKMIDNMRKSDSWSSIRDVIESFRTLRCQFPVSTLYELKATNVANRTLGVKTAKAEMLCDLRVSSLGWEGEYCVGVKKDHGELTMYPLRSDEDGYFETFMSTLTKMMDVVAPGPTQQAWARTEPSNDQNWLLVDNGSRNKDDGIPESILSYDDSTSFRTCQSASIPCFVMTPYEENPNFVGREDTLAAIHDALGPSNLAAGQKVFALTGLGGMGKTQTAVQYAFSQMEVTYKIVLWAHADGQSKLSESFSLFASELGLGDSLTHAKAKQAVKDYLATVDVKWLMIFDNADGDDKAELLAEFWPKGQKGSILITSRDKSLIAQYEGKFLEELRSQNAVSLLLKLTRMDLSKLAMEEKTAAQEIVKRVGFLPLGIFQAANLIMNLCVSFSGFLDAYNLQELIQDSSDVQLTPGSSYRYKYSLRTVWNMNFEKLNASDQSLLKMISFLDPDRIQMKLLLVGGAESTNPNLQFINTPRKVTKCRAGLLRSSLVSQNERKDELQMHRLVQAYCQLKMSPEEAQESFANAVSLVRQVWPVPHRSEVHNPGLWKDQRALLPHVQKLCELYAASLHQDHPLIPHDVVNWDFPAVVYEASWFCYESGMLESVEDLLNPAKDYCIRHLASGGGYRLLADMYGCYGSLCTESNQFQGAYDNFVEEWKYLELAFEAGELEKPSIWEVFGLGRLGNGYHGLHQYEKAEDYYRRALAAWGDLPGDRKIWHSHLATCLWLQGRPDEGETVVRAVIKDTNDTSNFRTAMAMYSLGNIQIAQATNLISEGKKEDAEEKLTEAMDTHVKVLTLWTKSLGPRHHKTSDAMYKVGWHLHRRQEYTQAMEMFERALDIYNSQPHLYKNEIARTKYKIGCLKQDTKHHSEGAALIREAEAIRQQIVPPNKWEPARSEEDFDDIVQFWTR